jgi:hypothetical protein
MFAEQVIVTIKCANSECNKEISFNKQQGKQTIDNPANVWMKSVRLVNTLLDNRVFAYCSDVCEITGARSGQHNPPEQKKIIEAANPAAVAAAAQAAEATAKSNENLKSGTGGPIVVAG